VTPESMVTEDDRMNVQAVAATWTETALSLGQFANSVDRTAADVGAAAGKSFTTVVKTIGGAAVLDAGWEAVRTVSSLIQSVKDGYDGPILEPRDPMERFALSISKDVQLMRPEMVRFKQEMVRHKTGADNGLDVGPSGRPLQ